MSVVGAAFPTVGGVCSFSEAAEKKDNRLIPGELSPKNDSTKASAGWASNRSGVSNWTTLPPALMTATRSPRLDGLVYVMSDKDDRLVQL